MDLLLCDKAYRTDRRGKIMCKVSGILCAHQYYCAPANRFKHLNTAADCPGKEMDDGTKDNNQAL